MSMDPLEAARDLALDIGGAPVSDYGDSAAEYQALTNGAGLVNLARRTRIGLTGEDRAAFLHNLCTNEIRKLPVGEGREAFLLDARGHVLAHVGITCLAESLLLETVSGQEAALLAHLDRYLIRERVQIEGRTATSAEWLVAGGESAAVLEGLTGSGLPEAPLSNVGATVGGRPVTLVGVAWTQAGGVLVIADAQDAAAVEQSLRASGLRWCGGSALDAARIESGYPWYGLDIDGKNLPQEVARDRAAISFVKGCYIGQETVARIDALGHVNRMLSGVQFQTGPPPPRGAVVMQDGQSVGAVTSSAFSPRLGGCLALAYLRRGAHTPGTAVGWQQHRGQVVALGAA